MKRELTIPAGGMYQEWDCLIAATDQEIDEKVFDLYGLTEEEREIVKTA